MRKKDILGQPLSKSKKDEPFKFSLGSGELIPGFEKGIVGMEVGQTKKLYSLVRKPEAI
ncbi:MAG: FKBP-type peptidyl-prolyl cis-trans isomerase [Thermodesulfobacteriota bacterium]|nr:FKBP-type peptidyl-prolyl cis-trans isomerase [Thermodesulfobacteriota bacterium]